MMIGNDGLTPLVWRSKPDLCNIYPHGVTGNRWLTHSELRHLVAWCCENIGPMGVLGEHTGCAWRFSAIPPECFLFRREADMVLFVLAHTVAG